MKSNAVYVVFLTLAILLPSRAFASDKSTTSSGETLYKEKCDGKCHDTRIHTRPNRIIHTYEDLMNRVRFCDSQANSKFSDQDITDVSDYLNDNFYKFVKAK